MTRIVQIGPYPLSSSHIRGGIEASVYGLSHEQSKKMDVHVFDIPRIGGADIVEQDGGVIVHRFCNYGRKQFLMASKARRVVEEICALKPEICHIHGTNLYQWLVYRKLKAKNQNVCVTVHGLVLVEKRNLLRKGFSLIRLGQYLYQGFVEKRFISSLPMAIVDTEYVREAVYRYKIKRKPEMYVIPQGINESFYTLNYSCDSNMILSVGAIGERKGHRLTLKAFELLRRGGKSAKLVIAGTVASQSYCDQLKMDIQNSDYGEDVLLLLDIPDRKLKQLYKDAGVFVLHSEEESQGIVFVEAMAVGLPVVATDVGGVGSVVIDGETGFLSPFGDIQTYAANIERLLNDKDLRMAMSLAAKQASSNYHWVTIAQKVCVFYKSNVNN